MRHGKESCRTRGDRLKQRCLDLVKQGQIAYGCGVVVLEEEKAKPAAQNQGKRHRNGDLAVQRQAAPKTFFAVAREPQDSQKVPPHDIAKAAQHDERAGYGVD